MPKSWLAILRNKSCLLLLWVGGLFPAQTLTSSLQKARIAVGESNRIEFRISGASPASVQSAPKNELLPFHFDELKDEIKLSPEGNYLRSVEFIVLDEGEFTIPALEFKVAGQVYRSTPYQLKVYNPANATDKLKEVMNNQQVELSWRDYWELYKFYILLAITVIAALIGGVMLWKYGRARKAKQEKFAATNKTLRALEELEKKKYPEKQQPRQFYVELIDILRTFLEELYHFPASLLLTNDLIQVMRKDNRIAKKDEVLLEEIFQRGDQAKFAKIFPEPSQMDRDLEALRGIVREATVEIELENLRQGV